MTITFISCYLTIHQVPICNELFKRFGDKFKYIAVNEMPNWRKESGYSDLNSRYPYVVKAYENERLAYRIAIDSDIVIIGSASDKYIINRLKKGKLTFKYSERFYKNGISNRNYLRDYAASWLHHGRFQKYPLYMLCASAYTASDCARFNNYYNKTFKWGYFPEAMKYNLDILFDNKDASQMIQLLWVGRLVSWKHPEMAIELANHLKKKGYSFNLTMIGSGELSFEIQSLIASYNLDDCVSITGALSPVAVRSYMESAHIFIMTSDYKEGWGAVVNEAMNSGCAVVACNAAGSVPFLIQPSVNGFTFNLLDQETLNNKVELLMNDSSLRKQFGINAYNTIMHTWNAFEATERLIKLSKQLLENNQSSTLFFDGPCSRAS